MLPSLFGENLFDDFFDDSIHKNFFGGHDPLYGKHAKNLMKTDVRELDHSYEVDIDLPGFQKDEVNLELRDGYLTVSASRASTRSRRMRRDAISARSVTAAPAPGASMWVT